jgi:energy-coupling factor transporter ATP-binding protein EcfA2
MIRRTVHPVTIYKMPMTEIPLNDRPIDVVASDVGNQTSEMQVEVAKIPVELGQTTVVVGPNGVGKSALLGEMARNIGQDEIVETFFGSRHLTFQDEDVDQVGQHFNVKFLHSHLNNGQVTRYRHPQGEQHLRSVIRRVLNQASQVEYNINNEAEQTGDFVGASTKHTRIWNTINSIFSAARMPISFFLEGGTLRARRGAATYGIDKLSDGERAAMLLTCAILIRPENSYIVIDEPERHLNPAISGPLLDAIKASRPDLGYIFSTHDLNLLSWLRPDRLIHLRTSELVVEHPEQRRYDFTKISLDDGLPESLRSAVLGARDKVLLVEGEATSDDQALYGLLFGGWHIVAKGGTNIVSADVAALKSNQSYHWLKVAGLIDGDGREGDELEKLAAKGVFALPVPTVESLFLNPVVLKELAQAEHAHRGGLDASQRLANAQGTLQSELPRSRDSIVARQLAWRANRVYAEAKLSFRDILDGQNEIKAIDLGPIRTKLNNDIDNILRKKVDLHVLAKIPVKETAIPSKISRALGFNNFEELKRAVLHHIRTGTPNGEQMRAALIELLPKLQD